MAAPLLDTLAARWRSLTVLTKIIAVNAGVFILLRLSAIVGLLTVDPAIHSATMRMFEMPSRLEALAMRPWTVLTYSWAQYDVMHILFNMLWLYWFGTIMLQVGQYRRVLPLYLLGGLGGALLYLVAMNTLPLFAGVSGSLIGSSAAVICIVTFTAIMHPDYEIGLLLLGRISIKWIAVITIGIDLLGITSGNIGGHISHLGGVAVGALAALMLKRHGADICAPVNRAIDRLTVMTSRRRRPKAKRAPNPKPSGKPDMATIDAILDKIKKSGYSSLTARERQILFNAGRK